MSARARSTVSARARSPARPMTVFEQTAAKVKDGKDLYRDAVNVLICTACEQFCDLNPLNNDAVAIRKQFQLFTENRSYTKKHVETYLLSLYEKKIHGLHLPPLRNAPNTNLGMNANGQGKRDTTPQDQYEIKVPAMAVYTLIFSLLARLVVTHVTACVLGYSQYHVTCYIFMCTVVPMVILWFKQPSQQAFAHATVLLYTKLGGMMMSRICIVICMLLLKYFLPPSVFAYVQEVAWVFDIISNLFYCSIAFNSITDEQQNESMGDTCHWFCVCFAGGFREVKHTVQQTLVNKVINTGILHTCLLCVILYWARYMNTGGSQLTRSFLCTGMVLSVWLLNTLQKTKVMCLRAVKSPRQSKKSCEDQESEIRSNVLQIATRMCFAALIAVVINQFSLAFTNPSQYFGAGDESCAQGESKTTSTQSDAIVWMILTEGWQWVGKWVVQKIAHLLLLPPLFLLDCTNIHLVQGVYEKCGLFAMYAEQAYRGSDTKRRMYRIN